MSLKNLKRNPKRCCAQTENGKRCKNQRKGEKFCKTHSGKGYLAWFK